MSDDELPLAPDGAHPRALAGKTAAEYLDLLWRARQATHATLRAWDDASLERIHVADGAEVTRAWILFHVVEHFAQHAGQITLLASLRRALSGHAWSAPHFAVHRVAPRGACAGGGDGSDGRAAAGRRCGLCR